MLAIFSTTVWILGVSEYRLKSLTGCPLCEKPLLQGNKEAWDQKLSFYDRFRALPNDT